MERGHQGESATPTAKRNRKAATETTPRASGAPIEINIEPISGCPTKVYNEILQGIYEGKYVPGQRLIEIDLTRELKVSRGSVREALNQLAAQGIVSQTMHRGAYVRAMTRAEVFGILSLIEVLMGLAAKLAAQNIHLPHQRKLLEASFKRLTASESRHDRLGLARAGDDFYAAITHIGGNYDLARLLPSMQVNLVRIQFLACKTDSQYFNFAECRRFSDAILSGDPRKAETAGRRHIERIRRLISQLPDGAFSPN
jgi:DNA-binding GntR family transcriptional regulator